MRPILLSAPASQDRNDLRPDRNHAHKQPERRQGGDFFHGRAKHRIPPEEHKRNNVLFLFPGQDRVVGQFDFLSARPGKAVSRILIAHHVEPRSRSKQCAILHRLEHFQAIRSVILPAVRFGRRSVGRLEMVHGSVAPGGDALRHLGRFAVGGCQLAARLGTRSCSRIAAHTSEHRTHSRRALAHVKVPRRVVGQVCFFSVSRADKVNDSARLCARRESLRCPTAPSTSLAGCPPSLHCPRW